MGEELSAYEADRRFLREFPNGGGDIDSGSIPLRQDLSVGKGLELDYTDYHGDIDLVDDPIGE